MKKVVLIFFLLLSVFVHAQKDNSIQVPGTHCKMIPPENFDAATSFSGFQQPSSGSSIMISELPTNYMELVNSFNKDALLKAGMILTNSDTIQHAGKPAYVYEITQNVNNEVYNKYILIFGNAKQTIMVNGIYPAKEKTIGESIIKSVNSIEYDEKISENGLDAVKFSVDPTGTSLLFSGYLSGALMYSTDGKMPTNNPDKTVFTAGSSVGNVNITDTKEFTISRLNSLPYGENNVIKSVEPVIINNLKGYEIVAEGIDGDKKAQLIYFTMLYPDNNSYYILVGMSGANFESNLKDFRKMAQTFYVK